METLRSYLELIYFISSGPILVIIAAFGLKQLKIAKDASRMAAKRESYKLAVDQCIFYVSHILPLQNKLDAAIRDRNITTFKKSQVKIEKDSVRVHFVGFEEDKEKIKEIAEELSGVLNNMETFALFFISGVADESIAFSSAGYVFCSYCKELLPFLVLVDAETKSHSNLIQLYILWTERIESMRILAEKNNLEERMKKVNNRSIKPLGTD